MPLAPNEVIQLVERFERNIDSYKSPAYEDAAREGGDSAAGFREQ